MLGSQTLEVAIGIIFVFMAVSTLVTAIREAIETIVKARAAHLEYAIRTLLNDPTLTKSIYEHPLIDGLYHGAYESRITDNRVPGAFTRGGDLPSYIPSKNFALALMDICVRGPVTGLLNTGPNALPVNPETIRANIRNIQNAKVQRVLLTALDEAQDNLERTRTNVEAWFDSSMDRVSGKYKRSSQVLIFWIGLVLAVALNIDPIAIGRFFYDNETARAAIVARAQKVTAADTTFDAAVKALGTPQIPFGGITHRHYAPQDTVKRTRIQYATVTAQAFVLALIGWLVTALAATLGAPFWFDMLNKVMVIRSTVKPREKSPEEGSEDRQPKTRVVAAPPPPPPPPPPPAPPQEAAPAAQVAAPAGVAAAESAEPHDAEGFSEDAEGCGVQGPTTPDEQLPASKGGVA